MNLNGFSCFIHASPKVVWCGLYTLWACEVHSTSWPLQQAANLSDILSLTLALWARQCEDAPTEHLSARLKIDRLSNSV
jgi:hypothetical protein